MSTVPAVTLRTSRARALLLFLGSLAALVLTIWVLPGMSTVMASLALVFVCACVICFGVLLLPGSSYLQVSPEGMTVCSLFRRTFIPWSQTDTFMVRQVMYKRMVVWNPPEGFRANRIVRWTTRAIAGAEAGLPDTYGMSPEALVQLLNERRQHYAALA